MIQFKCNCGQTLRVPESLAGDTTQCPHCGRLRSVPTLDELDTLADDGTINLSDDWTRPARSTAVEDAPAATGGRGLDPIELNYAGPVRQGGPPPTATRRRTPVAAEAVEVAKPADELFIARPKYDPETGERMTPVDLQQDAPPTTREAEPSPATEDPEALHFRNDDDEPPTTPRQSEFEAVVPQPIVKARPATVVEAPAPAPAPAAVAAAPGQPRTLSYVSKGSIPRGDGVTPPMVIRPVQWYTVPRELFQPTNLLVLGIIFAMHLVSQVFGLLAAAGGFPLVIVVVLIWLVIFAHYGVVIEETGPEAHDEIPPVLRNVSFYDDFLAPLVSLGVATALCAAPAVGVVVAAARFGVADGPTFLVTVLGAAFGLVAFPAVLLTLTTSGTLHNLLPHRLFGVAARSGPAYAAAVALLLLTLLCYGVGTGLTSILGLLVLDLLAWLFPGVPLVPAFLTTPVGGVITVAGLIGYPLLAAGIYFAHAFAWTLGKIYQQHHDVFPWVLQRHVSTRTDPTKQLELAKMAQLRAEREERAKRASAQVRERMAERV